MQTLTDIFIKSRYGRYEDNAKNRRLHRVGQEYGTKAKEEEGTEKQAKTEKRTFGRAKKELAAVLANKDAFINKYGEAKFNEKVGQLIGEAQQLNGAEKQAKMDGDFEALKQDKRSKKEIRTERLGRYKASLEKVKESLKDTSLSPASRKAGEAMQAKLEEKITKLEARIGGKRKAKEPQAVSKEPTSSHPQKLEIKGEVRYLWKEGDDYKVSPEDPRNNSNAALGATFKRSNGFESVDDVYAYIDKYMGGYKKVDEEAAKDTEPVEKLVNELKEEHYNEKYKINFDFVKEWDASISDQTIRDVLESFDEQGVEASELIVPQKYRHSPDAAFDHLYKQADRLIHDVGPNVDREEAKRAIEGIIYAKSFMNNAKPEAGEKQKKNLAKKSPARIVTDTLQKIKDHFGFGYGINWTDKKTEELQDILMENEDIVVNVMRGAFPSAASGSPMHPNTKEVDIDGKSFTFGAYSTPNLRLRGGMDNHYFVKDDYGKTIASSTSGGRLTTSADAKDTCKLDVLRTLLKF